MTTTLTLTSGQASFTAQGWTILPSPGTAVPDSVVQAIISAAYVSGVVLSSSAGTGTVIVGARSFYSSGTGPPSSGSWQLGDEVEDSTGAVHRCTAAGSPGTWVQPGSGTAALLAAANPDSIVTGTITRDSNGAATSAGVTWPDGTAGTYTADTLSSAFPGAVDAYHITYGSKTYTQPAVTRDATGAVTTRPALTVA